MCLLGRSVEHCQVMLGSAREACYHADEFGLYFVDHGEPGKRMGGNVT